MCYFGYTFEKGQAVAETVAHYLQHPKLRDANTVVGIGLSGTIMLPWVRHLTGREVIAFRKEGQSSHAGLFSESYGVEGYDRHLRYVILDDFVEQGSTLRTVRDYMSKYYRWSTCVGVLLYQGHYLREGVGLPGVPHMILGEEVAEWHKELEKA